MNDPLVHIRVMIVDDHRMFAESLARLLADEDDIEVSAVVESGSAALQSIERSRPHVVLLDYFMPDENGITIAEEIKRRDPTIMVVMLTGAIDDDLLLSAIEAGCSGFLTKDHAASEVADSIRAAAVGEVLLSPAMLARRLPRLSRSHRSLGDDLTDRERDTLHHLSLGWTNKVIAAEMHLSLNTVRNYVQSILNKLGAHSKLEAVSIAVRAGVIDYPRK
jgi:DNA-binding NarL/FixJ family response regulator